MSEQGAENKTKCCASNDAPKLVFACSCPADTGEITFLAAKELSKQGVAKMLSPAVIGGRVESFMAMAQSASKILALDGCNLGCTRRTLELAGLLDVTPLSLQDIGMKKGSTPPTNDKVAQVVEKATQLLNEE